MFECRIRVRGESNDRQASKDTKGEGDRMAWQAPEGMDEYQKPTELCDCDNERVKDKAHELIKGTETPREAACGYFVLSGTEYSMVLTLQMQSLRYSKRGAELCLSKAI